MTAGAAHSRPGCRSGTLAKKKMMPENDYHTAVENGKWKMWKMVRRDFKHVAQW
jgi:hypothetical protein